MEQRLADALVAPPDVPVHVPRRLRDLVSHVVQPLGNPLDPVPPLLVGVVGHLRDLLDAGQSGQQPELLDLVGDPVEGLDQGLRRGLLGRSSIRRPHSSSSWILPPVGHNCRRDS